MQNDITTSTVSCKACGKTFVRTRRQITKKVQFCTQRCAATRRLPLSERFLKKVDKNGPVPQHMPHLGRCWNWLASKRGAGYGQIQPGGKGRSPLTASRAAWDIFNGPIPEGLGVLHRCDNPACVNPAHLFLGTQITNMQDCSSKGRAKGPTGTGENSVSHKLTDTVVDEMRSLHPALSQRAIARRFGVCQRTVTCVVNRLRWNH
jgi:hypothetical protein